ncbi:2-hydroxyacid dehydrogenase [Enterovirga aerilata]|uniref:Glyoxylate/hydroxypyruvate reductase A n=1 Tax=Enterovirga aerilata TaxID=2730920 RepID=A0A849I8Z0_9HYPH|nr:glyoxylate/hydroxypyruvate reductase A [Enterovirga sp. DB1703]NNM73781.1 glyoxylate/hydroxypyruvate reductase A [Enterovirga sp. DB1703]
MTLLVAINGWDLAPWLDRFRRLLPERRVIAAGEEFDPAEIRYVASWKHTPTSLAGLPQLEAIFSLGAGVDHLIGDPQLPKVPIVRVVDEDLTERMSEYVVLHCLMHLRRQKQYDAQQRERRWYDDRDQPSARELRVGLLGLGVLGGDAARKLKVMGFDVAGWSRSPKAIEGIRSFAGEAELDAFLGRTDILVCLLPLTPATRGILNRALFAKLARDGRLGGPILINAGRGGLQVEDDILDSLDDGTLKAATLDVFATEPLPASSPLWTHPGVTITPHNAATSDPDAIAASIARHIRRHEAGEPWRDVVDPAVGY